MAFDVDVNKVLETSMEAGKIMLENGAEIFRVEDTMQRISRAFGVKEGNFFVLSNGIFTTGLDGKENKCFAKVEQVPVHGADLLKVIEINQLSREICNGQYTLDEVIEKIKTIREGKKKSRSLQIFATALGAGCFAILLGGTIWDSISSLIAGTLLGLFMVFVSSKYLSKITGNILASALVTIVCLLFNDFTSVPTNMMAMIGGSIIPLVPGVAFVNGIKDIGDGDYISGTVRLLDSMMVFLCIAVGVGVVLSISGMITGGFVL